MLSQFGHVIKRAMDVAYLTLYKKKADISKVAQKKEAIQKAIDRLNEGLWTLKTGPSEDNDR